MARGRKGSQKREERARRRRLQAEASGAVAIDAVKVDATPRIFVLSEEECAEIIEEARARGELGDE